MQRMKDINVDKELRNRISAASVSLCVNKDYAVLYPKCIPWL